MVESESESLVIYTNNRHIFEARKLPTFANYALTRTLEVDNLHQLSKTFYTADFIFLSKDQLEAENRKKQVVENLSRSGFKMTKFQSNIEELSENAEKKEESNVSLGCRTDSDTLAVCRIKDKPIEGFSQGDLLSVVSSLFDPLGFLSPPDSSNQKFVKKLWRQDGADWDRIIPEDTAEEHESWRKKLLQIKIIEITRNYFNFVLKQTDLHVFADASLEGLCVIAYFCASGTDENKSLSFVVGKTRVAPKKQLSIPKLELQAAVSVSRSKNNALESHGTTVNGEYMFSDSSTVLSNRDT